MVSVWFEILFILLLILLNGYLSMSEIAIVSARKIRLKQFADEGDKGAQIALKLAEQPGRFLSTVQIGITLIGILAGVFGGATIAEELARLLSQIPLLAPYSETISVVLIVLSVTYLTLVIGELAPKQIALSRTESIAKSIAPVMYRLSRIAAPLVHLLSASTNLVIRLLGIQPINQPAVTEEDIKILLAQGTEEGIFEPIEEEMVQQVFRLSGRKADELMTPRMDIVYLNINDSQQAIYQKIISSGFSRFPLVEDKLDQILGIIRTKDLLVQFMQNIPFNLKIALQPALFVPESSPIIQVLEEFRLKRLHMAIVLDEYGGTQGLLTPTDILETLVGDLPDLNNSYDPDIVLREDGSLLLDGLVQLDVLKELLQVKELPDEEESSYQTLGGLIMAGLSKVPITGDIFVWENITFEVMDMDGHRVDKVLVKKLPQKDDGDKK